MHALINKGHRIEVHDPFVDNVEARKLYNIDLLSNIEDAKDFDCVIGAVSHECYCCFKIF